MIRSEHGGIRFGPIVSWFPETSVAVHELPELATLSPARRDHLLSLGIERIRTADGMAETDMAARVGSAALREANREASELDALLLVQGRAPRYLLASEATRLQHELGAKTAFTCGIGDLGCVSVSSALVLAEALLRGSGYRDVLVVTTSRVAARARYRPPVTVLGDGASAVLLTARDRDVVEHDGYELVDQVMRSDGRYADLFRIDYRDTPSAEWTEACTDEPLYTFRLAVQSRTELLALNQHLLERNGLRKRDIAAFLMQNLAAGSFAFWEEALDLGLHPSCGRNLAAYGHLGPVDVLVNLQDAGASVPHGAYVVVMNSSPVAAWSSWLLRRRVWRE